MMGACVHIEAAIEAFCPIYMIAGICPQHDVLFEFMTVTEHFELLAHIKDVPVDMMDAKIAACMRQVDLDTQVSTLSQNLSGGQKRKLSVGLALIGDPKILCLDEPTSGQCHRCEIKLRDMIVHHPRLIFVVYEGMDPLSRRKLWNLLQTTRGSRVVLLTTHYMEDADLTDRKVITDGFTKAHVDS